jgi:hypothetical protein
MSTCKYFSYVIQIIFVHMNVVLRVIDLLDETVRIRTGPGRERGREGERVKGGEGQRGRGLQG